MPMNETRAEVMTSRRHMICGLASIALTARPAPGQGSPFRAQLRPVKEFRGAVLEAVSPDGKRMCVRVGIEIETWTFLHGKWSQDAGKPPQGDSLQVIELGSWKASYSTRLKAPLFMASFFRDSDELYVVTEPISDGSKVGNQQVVIDLKTKKIRQEEIRDGLYRTTRGQRLVTTTGSLADGGALALVALPGYKRVAESAVEAPTSGHNSTDLAISSEGDTFVYGIGGVLVCRRTDDLGVLWTRRLESPLSTVWRVAISASGDRVAAVAAAGSRLLQPLYFAVYDGRSGDPIVSLPATAQFNQTLAVSPDGKLLAVGQRQPAEDNQSLDLFVEVYDIRSGRSVARNLHCRVPPGGFQKLQGSFSAWGVQFTPDGGYLITAGYDRTRVWELSA